MNLWIKQSLLVLFVVLVLLGTCLLFFTSFQTENRMKDAIKRCENNISTITAHLNAVAFQNENLLYDADEITKRSAINYLFSVYARILQNNLSEYALRIHDKYASYSSYVPYHEWLPANLQLSNEIRIFQEENSYHALGYENVNIVGLPVTIYHSLNIDDIIKSNLNFVFITQLTLIVCISLLAVLLPLMIRKSLQPLHKLTQIAEAISSGNYGLRVNYINEDEVGVLSTTFDKMANTIEKNIDNLKETSYRQELLLAALTHELKTPMTAIIGYADGVLTLPLNEEQKNYAIKEIYDAATRVERLSQKMMNLIASSENHKVEKRTLSVANLLEEVKKITTAFLKEKNIVLNVFNEAETVCGDKDLLMSLLTNLVENAAKTSPKDNMIHLSAIKDQDQAIFLVKDKGFGIPEEQIPFVFEPFYRVDKARDKKKGGVGLGLSLCKMIVVAHRGNIEVNSTIDKGTEVAVKLPIGGKYE